MGIRSSSLFLFSTALFDDARVIVKLFHELQFPADPGFGEE